MSTNPLPASTRNLIIAAIAAVVLALGAISAWLATGNSNSQPGPTPSSPAPVSPSPSGSSSPATLRCLPVPSACGYPDATNTGVPAGYQLTTHPGQQTIKVDGTVIDGWDTGSIIVDAKNVVIRNSRITTTTYWGVHTLSGSVTLDHVTIIGRGRCDVGADSGSQTITNSSISGCVDGVHVHGDNLIENNLIDTKASADNTSHDDGIQVFSDYGAVIRHNTIVTVDDPRSNATIFVQPTTASTGLTIDDNLLDGGGYTLYIEAAVNVVASNNRIGASGKFGRISTAHGGTPKLIGNIADETGQPIG